MDFHKELHRIEAKEGLRGRKLQKALESFAWNITVLKVRGQGCAAPRPPAHPNPEDAPGAMAMARIRSGAPGGACTQRAPLMGVADGAPNAPQRGSGEPEWGIPGDGLSPAGPG